MKWFELYFVNFVQYIDEDHSLFQIFARILLCTYNIPFFVTLDTKLSSSVYV